MFLYENPDPDGVTDVKLDGYHCSIVPDSSLVPDTVRMIFLSLDVGYPKWKVRCTVAGNFP